MVTLMENYLSNTQKQAVVTVMTPTNREKGKRKETRGIKNWRPASLLNVDVKIGSKATYHSL